MEIDPSGLRSRDLYRLFTQAIVPRPIAWVSTVDAQGRPNLAPFSYFNAVSSKPPVVSVAIGYRRSGKKDTLANIEATGEFVVNLVTEPTAAQMAVTSGDYPPDVNEFEAAGLDAAPAVKVRPPRVAASPIQFECRTHRLVPVGKPPEGAMLVLGEVVHLHVREDVLKGGHISPNLLRAVGRLSGDDYCRTTDVLHFPA